MILADLKSYLQANRRVSLLDLANRFDVDPNAVRGMLEKWISKGRVRRLASGTACGQGCCQCDPTQMELYEWVE